MEKGAGHEEYFSWLTEQLRIEKEKSTRTIFYCQTKNQCGIIYAVIRGLLGKENMHSTTGSPLVEMLHSCTPHANKQNILDSFSQQDGTVRLLIATIAFGMGVDCKGVKRVIHYGPSKSVEAYIQETVFGDMPYEISVHDEGRETGYYFDDDFLDEWNEVFQDDELFDMSLSQLEASTSQLEESHDDSRDPADEEMPPDVLAALDGI
ncbi:predicted protein [Nematostella vectensis]|uniref:DNA 3'-5' helicase n=1 Tax=Nematostella vectensis TaxID=45351 RepID=A7SK64_NEMVE|nr:predicted protein [Nematostella vectensis]|eukprot:XP_001627949.1 predicted protein [Nematostella vectensis]